MLITRCWRSRRMLAGAGISSTRARSARRSGAAGSVLLNSTTDSMSSGSFTSAAVEAQPHVEAAVALQVLGDLDAVQGQLQGLAHVFHGEPEAGRPGPIHHHRQLLAQLFAGVLDVAQAFDAAQALHRLVGDALQLGQLRSLDAQADVVVALAEANAPKLPDMDAYLDPGHGLLGQGLLEALDPGAAADAAALRQGLEPHVDAGAIGRLVLAAAEHEATHLAEPDVHLGLRGQQPLHALDDGIHLLQVDPAVGGQADLDPALVQVGQEHLSRLLQHGYGQRQAAHEHRATPASAGAAATPIRRP